MSLKEYKYNGVHQAHFHSFLSAVREEMASAFVSYHACYNISYSLAKDIHYLSKLKLPKFNIRGNGSTSAVTKIRASTVSTVPHVIENVDMDLKQTRQNIPTTKQFVDPHRQGSIIENGVRYRQLVVIRSYEVGPDKTATLESILNLLQVNSYFFASVLMFRFT